MPEPIFTQSDTQAMGSPPAGFSFERTIALDMLSCNLDSDLNTI